MLTPLELAILAIGLGCDAFAVAVTIGMRGVTKRRLFRISWHAGLFQFMMPIAGYGLGAGLVGIVGRVAEFLGAVLLIIIALHMFVEGWRGFHGSEVHEPKDLTRGWRLMAFAFATSIDAMMVGLWLGIRGGEFLFQCGVIGVTAGLMAAVGMLLGSILLQKIGPTANIFGGIALFALGIRMFF